MVKADRSVPSVQRRTDAADKNWSNATQSDVFEGEKMPNWNLCVTMMAKTMSTLHTHEQERAKERTSNRQQPDN